MKVTIFSAVRQTLPCFHQTLRENKRSFAQFFRTEISRPIFLEIFIIEQGTICTFFLKHIVTILPFQIYIEHRERIVRAFEDVKRDEARRQGIAL